MFALIVLCLFRQTPLIWLFITAKPLNSSHLATIIVAKPHLCLSHQTPLTVVPPSLPLVVFDSSKSSHSSVHSLSSIHPSNAHSLHLFLTHQTPLTRTWFIKCPLPSPVFDSSNSSHSNVVYQMPTPFTCV